MKISICQLNPKVGDFDGNLAKALTVLEQVGSDCPDLVVLPELYLMGYPPQDLLERPWFIKRQEQALNELAKASAACPETGIVVGAALPSNRNAGRGLYNLAILIHQGRIAFTQAKCLLPYYDVFDEARYFDPADQIATFPFKGRILGLTVCEDAWNAPEFGDEKLRYSRNPVEELAAERPTVMINISASPFHAGKDEFRYRLFRHYAERHAIPFVFVNQVGGNDELVFDGGSMCLDSQGRPILFCPTFEEHVATVDIEGPGSSVSFMPQEEIESIYRALILGIRDYLGKSGFKSAVVGLSGGIDSAVTCALAVRALGPENVVGISMPSRHSSIGSVEDSRVLADNLKIDFRVLPIKGVYEAYTTALAEPFKGLPIDVTEENIQARIRGNFLMAFSNKFGHLVLSTGNKSEAAMGYCTLYGDMSGGLAVISDVPKMTVYELANFINREKEIIPQAIIDKAPSAELRPDQKDEDSLPPYDVLDPLLHLYVEEGRSREEIVDQGYDPEMVAWVTKMVNRSEFKRKQAPPGLKITTKAFGSGRRMPIVAEY